MEALAYRKNAVMVREALEPGWPLPAVKRALRRNAFTHDKEPERRNIFRFGPSVVQSSATARFGWFSVLWAGGGYRGRALLWLPPRRAGESDPDQGIQTSLQE